MEQPGVGRYDKRCSTTRLSHLLYDYGDNNGHLCARSDFVCHPQPDDTRHNPKLLQLINLTAVAIKRLIKMAKKITAFRDMCQEDQVALLKGGCTEMMIMRSVMIYDDDRDSWKVTYMIKLYFLG